MNRVIEIGEISKDIVKSFKRNDFRIRRRIASKYGIRKKNHTQNILNLVSNNVAKYCLLNKLTIVFEDIKYIRSVYRKGNFQARNYRRQMNNHRPFGEIKRQIKYKATWLGLLVIHLTKKETRGTSRECYICGERLQRTLKNDVRHKRQLWCNTCKRWFDRDLVAVMNVFCKGWLRFSQSKGIGSEAMVQERERRDEPLILKVDPMNLASKEGAGNQKGFSDRPKDVALTHVRCLTTLG